MQRAAAVAVLLAQAGVSWNATPTIVVSAPGFPGNTVQAQATMDAFARFCAAKVGWGEGTLAALYLETEAAGAERIRAHDVVAAIVTLPFYAKYRDELGLVPRLRADGETGEAEAFGLVARKGSLPNPAALDGWEIVGVPGYAPEFVRRAVLGAWGPLPAGARIAFSARVASALVRAASGQKVAVLVDGAQLIALPSHPNAADLEVVVRSKPLPSSVVCTRETARHRAEAETLVKLLPTVHRTEDGAAVLKSLRLERLRVLDAVALDRDLGLPARK